jgi:rhamnogalacturonyl hydrolase YesR
MGLTKAQREVAGMVHSGTPFHAIEDRIQVIPDLVDDERSGLWLYAWSRQSSVWQRNASSQLLLWLASGADRTRLDSR